MRRRSKVKRVLRLIGMKDLGARRIGDVAVCIHISLDGEVGCKMSILP
jgi:hypothetical protein